MSKKPFGNPTPLAAWQAETLRLTAFPSPAAQNTEAAWWTELVGEPPETSTSQPKKGERKEEGQFEGGKLRLRLQPARIDWLFLTIYELERGPEDFASIGPFPKVLDTFLRLMFKWFDLETCPPLRRLAFGATLYQPVDDRKAGYHQISAYLPYVKLDPEGSSDFTYQINRPRDSTSGISGLTINRLSKWSVGTVQAMQFSLRGTSASYSLGGEYSACRLELDVNTKPDFQGDLTREQLPKVFKELVDLGVEIATQGDIP